MSEMGPTPNICCLASLCSPLTSYVGLSKATVWQNIIRRKKKQLFFSVTIGYKLGHKAICFYLRKENSWFM